MKIARYKKGFISVSDYDSKLHFNNVYCPDCGKAKVKLVRKANSNPYFVFVDGEGEHDELCPYFEQAIKEDVIKSLLSSESKKDMSKLNFLVNSNLERSINLLSKLENDGDLNYENILDLMPKKRQFLAEKRIREYKKQNIQSINAEELGSYLEEIKNKYVVVYGTAGISISDIEDSKKIIFKINKDSRFSIFLAPQKAKYLKYNGGIRAKFAVFGKIKVSGEHVNIEVRSTRDLVIKE
ncbi:hypothetical protein [Francisella frigiditurris]|uniref:Uncharacterized protein n=1 Tax=Francisella frigiditurris TaxID=1542390 RepID=A0A1J0KT10_9GAMM|nr:hypothetical protein [Francisella frigiditurris]APC96834.1 hypothetical protein KX01_895 [Francisella frigiditurris]